MRMILVPVTAMIGLFAVAPGVSAPQDPKPVVSRWQDDPACRMVFFAVLEGLYTDGVPNEVVDLITPKEGDAVRHSFVVECPLCHPVLEAFRLYQSRRPFAQDKGDTFGKMEVKPELLTALKSDSVFTRIQAMGRLVQPWIERRLALMRLDAKEMAEWKAKLLARAKEGGELFDRLKREKGSTYEKDWQFYAGCQACEAVERAVNK